MVTRSEPMRESGTTRGKSVDCRGSTVDGEWVVLRRVASLCGCKFDGAGSYQ
jgi:hypothetical protein